ncbi:MAG: hypothetical protein M3478_07040 [Planctomycetota bacterium]|nr:hypothetical protein [Planctomycetota bacterium]
MRSASRIPSPSQPAAAAAARPTRAKEPRVRLNVLADTISTYLTLVSSLILPVLLIVWARSYLVSDRVYHADDGVAMVAGLANGEVAVWAGPTMKDLDLYMHRPRQSNWGQSSRRTFQRYAGRDHVWFAGFGYAKSQRFPWRDVPLTGRAIAVCVPLWFVALIVGALPLRLLARNMQSSADFLAERAAERQTARPI